MKSHPPRSPAKGDQYEHDDGTIEVVFTSAEGRVLTVREYPDVPTFERTVDRATYRGTHSGIAELPGLSAFDDREL
ncbi:hypothetical protein [Halegenticoccus soli]|uniref:hypothetical protein n=1 Tax=Halegenticoccus soli TaxID=1985678 RepID=UPI000C6D2120|nr:hypothetical protein [Halegenticoccus soli]